MRKSLIVKSPILLLILTVIAVGAILFPHDIKTTNECAFGTCDENTSYTRKSTGFPYVWSISTKETINYEDRTTSSKENKKLLIDIGAWLALILLVGLIPVKVDV